MRTNLNPTSIIHFWSHTHTHDQYQTSVLWTDQLEFLFDVILFSFHFLGNGWWWLCFSVFHNK